MGDRGLSRASDDDILALAVAEGRVLVSEDTDFGALIARSGARVPSLVLIRAAEPLTPDEHAAMLVTNLPQFARDLEAGAVVVLCEFGHSRSSRRTEPPSLVGIVPCGPVTSSSAP